MTLRSLLPALALLLSLVTRAPSALADPASVFGPTSVEDLVSAGDVDGEDIAGMRLGAYAATSDLHGSTWVSLLGYAEQSTTGGSGFGAGLIVGVAFDRIAQGPVHVLSDPTRIPTQAPAPAPTPPVTASATAEEPVSPRFARECVAAALRTSGLGVDDARLDDLVSRARASAWLPETRMRAERVWNDSSDVSVYSPTDPSDFYDAIGANFALELRLTWRLDRLIYAGDEPMIERVRLQRQYERTRLATQVLEVLFAWHRAEVAAADAPPRTKERWDAEGRAAEAHATLDVLTGGWFSDRRERDRGRTEARTPP